MKQSEAPCRHRTSAASGPPRDDGATAGRAPRCQSVNSHDAKVVGAELLYGGAASSTRAAPARARIFPNELDDCCQRCAVRMARPGQRRPMASLEKYTIVGQGKRQASRSLINLQLALKDLKNISKQNYFESKGVKYGKMNGFVDELIGTKNMKWQYSLCLLYEFTQNNQCKSEKNKNFVLHTPR